jgi:GT2 family glycosyltransferase
VQDGFPTPIGFKRVAADEPRARAGVPVRFVHPDPVLTVVLVPLHRMANEWHQIELHFPPEGVVDVFVQFAFAGGRVLWQRLPALARNRFLIRLRFDGALERLTLHLSGSGRLAEPSLCRVERLGLLRQLAAIAERGVDLVKRDGFGVVRSAMSYLWRLMRPGSIVLVPGSTQASGELPYDTWVRVFDEAPERDRGRHAERLGTLSSGPLISVLVVLDATDPLRLDRMARGLAGQIYPEWQLLVATPEAQHATVWAALAALEPSKLRVGPSTASQAESFNSLLAEAAGEFVLPLRADAQLRPHALLDLVITLGRHPTAEAIYCDEDVIDGAGRRSAPRFKPAWSPDLLAAHDYFGDLTLLRTATVRRLRGWRPEAGAAHRHNLLLRLTGTVAPNTIVHLAKVLVHGANDGESTLPRPHTPRHVSASAPRVSLIIPTRDNAELLSACIRSIRQRTHYPDYEILIIDNGSVQHATTRLLAELAADPAVRVLPRPGPFNFSGLNNSAAHEASGAILVLLNDDTEATEERWLEEMVLLAARPEIGCVGARLVYPDGRLQHGGIILGLLGVAGHAHRFAPASEPGYLNRLRTVQDVSAVTAACLAIRKDLFEQVGGFDESLTVAFNDVDFCLKVRAAGYRNVWTPFATLIHHESVSRGSDFTPSKAGRFAQEIALVQRRWGAQLLSDPYYSPHLTYDREDFSVRLR